MIVIGAPFCAKCAKEAKIAKKKIKKTFLALFYEVESVKGDGVW